MRAAQRLSTTFVLVMVAAGVYATGDAMCAQVPATPGKAPATEALKERQPGTIDEHQKKLLNDADQLTMLALKLKASVDRSNKDTLSVDVVRDAERLERLARQVRDNKKL